MTCPKQTYPTHKAAISAALGASRKRGTALRVYPCKECRGFHLTKRPAVWNRKRSTGAA
jgi:hypothetical protein